ncbi:hypothetical protein, partial [Streptomyces sp. NPDC001139]
GRIDVPGALLLAAASTCLVLLTSWGGTEYAWPTSRAPSHVPVRIPPTGSGRASERTAPESLFFHCCWYCR